MVEALDQFITIREPITLVVFAVCWIYGLVSLIRKKRPQAFAAMVVGAVFIASMFPFYWWITWRVRNDVHRFLAESNGPFVVFVEGTQAPVARVDSLIDVLRSVRPMPAHHSHPTYRVDIRVIDHTGGVLNLELGRDVDVPREYWVFQPDYATTSNNEVGRIVTPLFDSLGGAPK